MNRNFADYFEGVISIKIEGRKIDRFLSYLYKLKIHILDVKIIDRQNMLVKIYHRDLEKVMSLKTTYEVNTEGYEGKLRLKEGMKKHFFLLFSLFIGIIILFLLSHVIFDVEVIHSNAKIRNLILSELSDHGIKRWEFKRDFKGIEKIKGEILSKYKDRLEWLEIENVGTKYIVKVEERKIIPPEVNYTYQDIVSTKNAIILKIEASEGEIVKHKNDYVKAGDVLISGRIMKGEEVSKLVKANGKIYGEVWYNIKVEHPLIYQTKIPTGEKKNVYKFNFLSKSFTLFDFKPYTNKTVTTSKIASSRLLPFGIVKEIQKEVVVQDEIYTDSDALIRAEEQAKSKMKGYLSEDEYIISSRKLKYYIEDEKLYLEIFFKVYENIGEPRAISE